MIIGGVAAGSGEQNLALVILCASLGAFLGDNIAYLIGRHFSGRIDRYAAERPEDARAPRLGGPTDPPSRRAAARHGAVHPGRPDGDHGELRHHPPAAALVRHVDGDRRGDLGHLRRRARVRLRRNLRGRPHDRLHPRLRRGAGGDAGDRGGPPRPQPRRRTPTTNRRVRRTPRGDRDRRGPMLAVVPVRDGVLPAGASRRWPSAADGRCSPDRRPDADVARRRGVDRDHRRARHVPPGTLGRRLARHLGGWRVVVLPAWPDGRDLAPRLAHRLGRDLLAAATARRVRPGHARPRRWADPASTGRSTRRWW